MRAILILLVVTMLFSGCDSKTDSERTSETTKPDAASETSKAEVEKLPAPHPPPKPASTRHALRFVAQETTVCPDPEGALGTCEAEKNRRLYTVKAGKAIWVDRDAEGESVKVYRRADSEESTRWVAKSALSQSPPKATMESLAKTRESWKSIPLATRKNLVDAKSDQLFRLELSSHLLTPRSETIDGVPHPVSPLKVDSVGPPTPLELRFADCLLEMGPEAWARPHECVLTATCAELNYVCAPEYCDEPTVIARRLATPGIPAMEVVAVADRRGTYVCPEFEESK